MEAKTYKQLVAEVEAEEKARQSTKELRWLKSGLKPGARNRGDGIRIVHITQWRRYYRAAMGSQTKSPWNFYDRPQLHDCC